MNYRTIILGISIILNIGLIDMLIKKQRDIQILKEFTVNTIEYIDLLEKGLINE